MATLTIDTHKAVTVLKDKGFSEQQAEGIVDVFKDAELNEMATKDDIQTLKNKINNSVGSLRSEMYKALMVQTLVIIGAIVGILQLIL